MVTQVENQDGEPELHEDTTRNFVSIWETTEAELSERKPNVIVSDVSLSDDPANDPFLANWVPMQQQITAFGIGEPATKQLKIRFLKHEVHSVKVVQRDDGDFVLISIESPPYAFPREVSDPPQGAATQSKDSYVKPPFEACCNEDCPYEQLVNPLPVQPALQ